MLSRSPRFLLRSMRSATNSPAGVLTRSQPSARPQVCCRRDSPSRIGRGEGFHPVRAGRDGERDHRQPGGIAVFGRAAPFDRDAPGPRHDLRLGRVPGTVAAAHDRIASVRARFDGIGQRANVQIVIRIYLLVYPALAAVEPGRRHARDRRRGRRVRGATGKQDQRRERQHARLHGKHRDRTSKPKV